MNADNVEFMGIYRQHVGLLRSRAQRILGDASGAQDLVQETFIRYLHYQKRGGTAKETTAFLHQICTNLALNQLRNSKRQRQILTNIEQETVVHNTADERILLRQVLAEVGEEEAQIAAYYYIDGMEQDEIAALLQMNRRTVGRRLERFRQQATQHLKRDQRQVM